MTPWPNLLPATADAVETIWTAATSLGVLASAIGAGITTSNLRAARRARRLAIGAVPANRLHIMITDQAVRNEWISVVTLLFLLVMLALFVAIGGFAMLTPDPVRPELRAVDFVTTVVLVIGALIATAAALMLTIGSILNRRDRHRLMNRITARLLRGQLIDRGILPPQDHAS